MIAFTFAFANNNWEFNKKKHKNLLDISLEKKSSKIKNWISLSLQEELFDLRQRSSYFGTMTNFHLKVGFLSIIFYNKIF